MPTLLRSFTSFIMSLIVATTWTATALPSDHVWTGAGDDDFFSPANWDTGTAPIGADALAVIDNGQTAVIAADTGDVLLGGFQLGTSGPTGGNVIQNGGTLIVAGSPTDALPTSYEFKSHIGDQGTQSSSWVMNNNSVMLYDGPLSGDGNGLGTDGINSYDLEVGARVGVDGGVGSIELHDNAILRISDDLKVGAEDGGNGIVAADGDSQITVGSGISLGENTDGVGRLHVAGNALVVTGNSAGPGESVDGRTNEGYLTLSTDNTGVAEVTITDNGHVYARTLQQRQGRSTVSISGDGRLDVFEVFEYEGPEFGTATIRGSVDGNERTTHVSSSPDSQTIFTLTDQAVFSVDSDIPDSQWSGFALSGGTNKGGNGEGGFTSIDIRDAARFVVVQDLHMTMGTSPDAESVLAVTGPDATVQVIGDLRMALDPGDNPNPGVATIQATLTADTHSTINVGGAVNLDSAGLVVELGPDYEPDGGESYTLINAGSLTGDFFKTFSLPELFGDLNWDFEITETDVILFVTGGPAPVSGDFDLDGLLTTADIDLLNSNIVSGENDATFDLNGDGNVDLTDQSDWLRLAGEENGLGGPFLAGDTNLDGTVNANDLNAIGLNWQENASAWTQGDLNADGIVNASDLNLIGVNWQKSAAAASNAAVPEPSPIALLGFAAFGFASVRRRCRMRQAARP